MNKALFGAVVASTFGLNALSAVAADMTPDERAELRTRADQLKAERVSAPQTGDLKLDQDRGEVKLNPRGDNIKAKPAKMKKPKQKTKRAGSRKAKLKAAVKKIPGALVR